MRRSERIEKAAKDLLFTLEEVLDYDSIVVGELRAALDSEEGDVDRSSVERGIAVGYEVGWHDALDKAAALCERVRCRKWSPQECSKQIRRLKSISCPINPDGKHIDQGGPFVATCACGWKGEP